jgi:glutathione S-transferase
VRLFGNPNSPFARKVMVCAIERGLEQQITSVPATGEDPELARHNPLGKLPCLVTDDGVALFDSPVICEFLDHLEGGVQLFPEHGLRVRALRLQALGDGISDAAVLARGETQRAADPDRQAFIALQKTKITRSLDFLEREVPSAHLDIGAIAVACALGYLDLRFPGDDWRAGRPLLTAWFDAVSKHPGLARTKP